MKETRKNVDVYDAIAGKKLGTRTISEPFMIYCEKDGDLFTETFETKEDALQYADAEWGKHFTAREKKNHIAQYLVAEITAVDEEGIFYNYEVIKSFK